MSNYPGFFVTLEGGERCGKTTQLNLLIAKLGKKNFEIIATKEPGSPHLQECVKIREKLLDPSRNLSNKDELNLYIKDRVIHMRDLVIPNLLKGKIVISDRFADSTVAYQHYGRGWDFELVQKLNRRAAAGIEPDLTFLLDIDPMISFSRIKGGLDRLEKAGSEFHKRVNEGYRQIAKKFPKRFVVIDALRPVDEIHKEIFFVTIKRLNKAGLL